MCSSDLPPLNSGIGSERLTHFPISQACQALPQFSEIPGFSTTFCPFWSKQDFDPSREELNCGILIPLQKPGKKKGLASNLHPVILLSMIRKIFAIYLIRRIGKRTDKEIPTYQQLLTIKLMAEKAANTPNYLTDICTTHGHE